MTKKSKRIRRTISCPLCKKKTSLNIEYHIREVEPEAGNREFERTERGDIYWICYNCEGETEVNITGNVAQVLGFLDRLDEFIQKT